MPVIIANCVRIKGVKKGSWELNAKPSFGTVRLGLGNGSYGHGRGRKSNLILTVNGKIFFGSGIHIANNFSINIGNNANLTLGRGFNSNFNLIISVADRIEFGEECLLGWNCTFIDSDGHKFYDGDDISNKTCPLVIGKHVWIASNATILKGTIVANESVVGCGSAIGKTFLEPNCLIVGNPGRVVKKYQLGKIKN